jgi:hypothetical protein
MKKEGSEKEHEVDERNERLLKKKYYLDKIGYGFSSTQFINILFSFTGASLLFIGIINGLKSFLNTFISTFIKEITEKREITKKIISISGLIFGFSFLMLALAVTIKQPILFAVSLLIGSIGVAAYGELFNNFLNKYSKKGKLKRLSSKSTFKGLIIAAISMILAAGIIDLTLFGGDALTITILGEQLTQNMYGYLITFEITAFAFIISSYLFAKVKIKQELIIRAIDYRAYCKNLIHKSKAFFKNKYLMILTLGMLFVSVFQSIINSYTGIYVYEHLRNEWLGGFMNVAVMYAIALLIAIIGPIITSRLNKTVGVVPMFVFGATLMALLPLTIVYNPYFYPAMVAANSLSVLGAALIGSAQGSLASKVLSLEDRQNFYSSAGFLSLIPFIILVSICAYIAQTTTLQYLFKVVGFGLIIFVVPIYFLIVILAAYKEKDSQ